MAPARRKQPPAPAAVPDEPPGEIEAPEILPTDDPVDTPAQSLPTERLATPYDHVAQFLPAPDLFLAAVKSLNPSSIEDILEFTQDEWSKYRFKVGDDRAKLSILDVKTLGIIREWYYQQDIEDNTIFYLTETDLRDFRRSRTAMAAAVASPAPRMFPRTPDALPASTPIEHLTSSPAASSNSNASVYDDFRRSIRWSTKDFEPFKDAKRWNLWYRRFVATAEAQDLSNILNPRYHPVTNDERRVFQSQKIYLFQVFTIVLHEPTASELLRKYSNREDTENYGDSQKIHAALVERFTKGSFAQIQRADLVRKINAARLDKTWNKSICQFLTGFSHMVYDIRSLRAPDDQTSYSDPWCIDALNTALSSHTIMYSYVQNMSATQATLKASLEGVTLEQSYETYQAMLYSYAVTIDSNSARTKQQRTVNSTQSTTGRGGGRNSGRSNMNGRGRGGRGNSHHTGTKQAPTDLSTIDPTDPSFILTNLQWRSLSNEQKQKRRTRQEEARKSRAANQTQVDTSHSSSGSSAVPPTI